MRPARNISSPAADPRRVLIVDDNTDAADSLAILLTMQGHETKVAYNAKEALECSEEFRPDVGLLDIGLPDISGYELGIEIAGKYNSMSATLISAPAARVRVRVIGPTSNS